MNPSYLISVMFVAHTKRAYARVVPWPQKKPNWHLLLTGHKNHSFSLQNRCKSTQPLRVVREARNSLRKHS